MHHRLFQRLDAALFESVVAGEVRALAHDEGEAESVFRGLARLCSEVTAYRWLAVHVHSPPRLFIHVQRSERLAAEVEVRAALDVPADVDVSVICDDRPVTGRASTPITAEVRGAAKVMGTIALGPNPRGASRDDRDLVSMVAAELGGPLRIVALVEQSRRLAMSDPLTGLLNRRAFTDLMTRSLASLERYGEPVSLLLLDVDHFKQVNDAHGHDAGDAVLITIADVLRRLARETDFVARWGGEEFVVGLAHTGIPASLTPAERVRRAIIEQPFALPGGGEILGHVVDWHRVRHAGRAARHARRARRPGHVSREGPRAEPLRAPRWQVVDAAPRRVARDGSTRRAEDQRFDGPLSARRTRLGPRRGMTR